jgi:uncharacterized protein
MGKILFWAVVIIGILFLTRLLASHTAKGQSKQPPIANSQNDKDKQNKQKKQGQPLGEPEEMVRCAKCGVYMPRSEAIRQSEQFWCSTEHAQAGSKTRT